MACEVPTDGFDVLIVGGGAMGSSVAYHLRSDCGFSGAVAVVERDPTYARASSALSASSIRQQFSAPLNIHLSRHGIGFLRQAWDLPGIELGLKEPGYLFLATPASEAVLRANHAIQRGKKCSVELLEQAVPAARLPWISTDNVTLASHGTANEGWFDGPALMQGFRGKARELEAEYIADEAMELAPNAVILRWGVGSRPARRRPPATIRRSRRSKSSTPNGTTLCGRRWRRGCRPSKRPRW